MSGYVRQSSADILPTAVIRATPVNNEFNALRDAFAQSGGHKHDGTAAEGDYVPLIADSSAKDKVVIDATNHRVGLFVNVAGTSTEQLRVQSGALLPVTTNALDIGSNTFKVKDAYLAGNAYLTTGSLTGQLTSTLASGTAPFVIASTTKVANLNADLLDGNDWASPAAIGTTTPAAGTFTNLTANTSLTATTAAISAGTINNTVIGGTTAQAITGTLITATTGFVGGLTGNVTGNTTGTHTGGVIGNVTGDVTGNVTASTGTSSFNDVTINGTLNMNAGTAATITNLTSPTNSGDAATKGYVDTADALKLNLSGGTMSGAIAMGTNKITGLGAPTLSTDAATKTYVDTSISNLVASAPAALDTLNELAAALGNDASFSTTVTNSIAAKLPLAGGTMSGAIAMGTNKITGMGNPTLAQDATTKTYVDTADALKLNLTGGTMSGAIAMGTSKITGMGDPTANQDAATKNYVDTQSALKLSLTGGTMSGAIAMGTSKITGLGDPTANQDAATKIYVDGILGSATSAATSAAAAATSASNAATSASNASTSASNAATSASSALTYLNTFKGQYYGSLSADPSLDPLGNAIGTGDLYWNSTSNEMRVYNGTAWVATYLPASGYMDLTTAQTAAGVKTFSSNPILSGGTANGVTYLNGSKVLTSGSAFTFDGTTLGVTSSSNVSLNLASTSGYSQLILSGGSSANYITSDDPLSFYLAGSEGMRLTSTGLGIGTSSPAVKLDVTDSRAGFYSARIFNTSVTGYGVKIKNGNDANDALRISNAADTADNILMYGSGNAYFAGNVGIGTTSPTTKIDARLSGTSSGAVVTVGNTGSGSFGGLAITDGGSYPVEMWASALVFKAGNSSYASATEQMRLTSTGLGIGTSSPAYKLDVGGSSRIGTSGASTALLIGSDASTTGGLVFSDATRFISGSIANNPYLFYVNNAEQMRLNSTGLGIGTSSPADKLHIVGTGTNAGAGYLVSRFMDSTNAKGVFLGYDTDELAGTIYGANFLTFQTYNGSAWGERMRLDTAGNLGLGVTPNTWYSGTKALEIGATTALMDISGQTNLYQNGYLNAAGNVIYKTTNYATQYRSISGQHQWFTAPSGTAGNAISFTQAMTLDASGNLGVGTTTPANPTGGKGFEISNASGASIRASSSTSNLEMQAGGSATYLVSYGAFPFIFYINAAERARISAAGGFSVGTTADPGAGAIYATGAITAYYSDARLKTVSGKIENALDKVAKLSGVYYTNNDTAKSFGYTSDEVQVGVLAQEVEAVMPEIVKAAPFDLDENNNSKSGEHYKTVQYEKLVPLLIEAINELQAKVKLLENK